MAAPVRNDLHSVFIHMMKCKKGEARNAVTTSITPNCILLPHDTRKEGALILRELKTRDSANPKLYSTNTSVKKDITKLLAAKDLVVTCKSSCN